jgi:Uncharacterized membrane protein (DUF2298)/Dolichyl-phosphate-mannose-protein mannosyltransferase
MASRTLRLSPSEGATTLQGRDGSRLRLLGAVYAVGICALYMMFFWKRFFPIQEGWLHYMGMQIAIGKVPYRDFYLFLQPIYPLEFAALYRLFGNAFIVSRMIGVIERCSICLVLYLWLSQMFPVRRALFAALVTLAIFSSNVTDVVYGYYQTCLLLSLLASFAASLFLTYRDRKHAWWLMALAGLCAGAAFMVKQTTGLVVLVLAPAGACCLLLRSPDRKLLPKALVGYTLACAVPIALLWGWLAYEGAFPQYIQQVFRSGTSSKGSLWAILFGALTRTTIWEYPIVSALVAVGLALAIRYTGRPRQGESAPDSRDRWWTVTATALVCGCCFAVPYVNPAVLWKHYWPLGIYWWKLAVVHGVFVFCTISALRSWGLALLRRELSERTKQEALITSIAAGIMYAHGLSYTIEEHSAVPGVGFTIAWLLCAFPSTVAGRSARGILCALSLALITMCAVQKYMWPYYWWGWQEPPVASSRTRPRLKELRGLRIARSTEDVIFQITMAIKRNSAPSDTIFTFPHIPLFYLLTSNRISTYAYVNYFDVCPDWVASADAKLLLANPPAVIVWMDFPEDVWRFHETAFRGGKRSGQRDIQQAVSQLIHDYKLIWEIPSRDHDEYPIRVWARNPVRDVVLGNK